MNDKRVTYDADRLGKDLLAHEEGLTPIGGRLTPDDIANLNSVVFRDQTGTFRRSAAAVRSLWALGGVWGFLGWCLWLIPWPLRDLGYVGVARMRYRLFGQHGIAVFGCLPRVNAT